MTKVNNSLSHPLLLEGSIRIETASQALSINSLFIDVRTPDEFAGGSVPGAINIPLFENDERSLIGTLYKQISREAAIQRGLSIVEPRFSKFFEKFMPFQSELLTIYCARGGMRSFSVVRMLEKMGFNVQQLKGGYKSYRHHVLQALNSFSSKLIVLHGQTGVGKTRVLQKLPQSIDLEGLAQHRSSLFGAINRTPRTQKSFEALLHQQLTRFSSKDSTLFIEGESRKVGKVFIPQALAHAMKKGHLVLLTASLATRIQHILEDYLMDDETTWNQIREILQSQSLRVALGHQKIEWLCECLKKGKLEEIVRTLLVDYYDPRYQHGMQHYDYSLTLSAENIPNTRMQLIQFRDSLNKS